MSSASGPLPATLGHYRILEKVGEGGMGLVYRAHDEHLERDVAIKVLPRGAVTEPAARKRFRKEALALSKLNHPNIATVFDFDTDGGADFLVMEYITGATLAEQVAPGALPQREISRLGAELAAGLGAAHRQGIIHCDLKPGNLKITGEGQLKILDFGLARLLRVPADLTTASLTEAGTAGGTLPYMAPEQLQGAPPDARTDIYAAGVVLYEMATGKRPFDEDTPLGLFSSIAARPPVPPSTLNPRVSPQLEIIILKCLDKLPENRYQSAADLEVDLRRLQMPGTLSVQPHKHRRTILAVVVVAIAVLAGAGYLLHERWFGRTAPRVESIAVLPLANMSGDSSQEYFADGMTETLITELSKISSLKIISRTSVMRYKGTNRPLPEIARELKVDAVVEGSVLRVGDRVRITAQLIQAAPEQHLWADVFDRDLRDVLALHSEVASAIARQVRATLTTQEQARLGKTRRVDPEAHEAYLKARFLMAKFTEEDVTRAVVELERALARDPDDGAIHASLAFSHFYLAVPLRWQRSVPWQQDLAASKAEALRAVALDDALAEAHAALGTVLLFKDWDWAAAEREYRRAIELDPNSSEGHRTYAVYLICAGKTPAAIAEMERAVELDPVNLATRSLFGELLYDARQYDRAEQELKKVVELDPSYQRAVGILAWVYRIKGDIPAVLDVWDKNGTPPDVAAAARRAYNAGGTAAFNRFYAQVQEEERKRSYLPPFRLAKAYAFLHDEPRTLAYLREAFEEHDHQLVFLRANPEFDFLHANPGFQTLVRQVGIPQ